VGHGEIPFGVAFEFDQSTVVRVAVRRSRACVL
jgi:hypothetical protein